MHFPRENAYFSGSRAGKKCIYTISRKFVYAFFGVAWNLKNMHFPRENAYFSGSRAGKKMHIHNFLKKLYMHFLGWPGISKICIFLGKMHIFQDPGLEKKMHIHNFPKNLYMHFLGWPGISKICIFLGKMHIFQDPGLEKKCIYTFFPKNGKIPPICKCIFL